MATHRDDVRRGWRSPVPHPPPPHETRTRISPAGIPWWAARSCRRRRRRPSRARSAAATRRAARAGMRTARAAPRARTAACMSPARRTCPAHAAVAWPADVQLLGLAMQLAHLHTCMHPANMQPPCVLATLIKGSGLARNDCDPSCLSSCVCTVTHASQAWGRGLLLTMSCVSAPNA